MTCVAKENINYMDGFLLVVIQIIAISGNSLFFVGLIKFPSMRNTTNIFLCCLASADIIVALIPMSVTFAIYACNFGPRDQTDLLYKDVTLTYIILDIACGTASILSLTVIAMDRYFAINWPFVHERVIVPKLAACAVVAIWLIAFTTSLIRLDESLPKSHILLSNILISFGIPLLVMTYCYVNIAVIARRQSIRIAQLTAAGLSSQRRSEQTETETTNMELSGRNEAKPDVEGSDNHATEGKEEERKSKKETVSKTMSTIRRGTIHAVTRLKKVGKELKAAKTLGIVMGVFILTWTPFMSLNIISYMYCHPYTPKCKEMLSYNMAKYFKLLHYASSALNPCLYVLLNRKWRDIFRQMLCCCIENRISGEMRTSLVGGW